MKSMKTMADSELLERFTQAARNYDEAIEHGSVKEANRNTSIANHVVDEFKRRGTEQELIVLFDHPIPIVRGWAAAYALDFAPDAAVPILEDIINNIRGTPATHARASLLMWQDGIRSS